MHILFTPPQHTHLAEKEHNDLLIIFFIPMGIKCIPLEELKKKFHSTIQVSLLGTHKYHFPPPPAVFSYCFLLSSYLSKYSSVKQGSVVPQNLAENLARRQFLLIVCHTDQSLPGQLPDVL